MLDLATFFVGAGRSYPTCARSSNNMVDLAQIGPDVAAIVLSFKTYTKPKQGQVPLSPKVSPAQIGPDFVDLGA